MKERYHIDMEAEGQHSKLLSDLPPVDGVITMGCNVACPSVPCAWREDWGLDDPTGQPDDVFLETIRQIEEKILQLKERLRLTGAGAGCFLSRLCLWLWLMTGHRLRNSFLPRPAAP